MIFTTIRPVLSCLISCLIWSDTYWMSWSNCFSCSSFSWLRRLPPRIHLQHPPFDHKLAQVIPLSCLKTFLDVHGGFMYCRHLSKIFISGLQRLLSLVFLNLQFYQEAHRRCRSYPTWSLYSLRSIRSVIWPAWSGWEQPRAPLSSYPCPSLYRPR